MRTVRLAAEEYYIAAFSTDDYYREVDLPADLADEYERTLSRVLELDRQITAFLRAVQRDENAYKEVSEPLRRRLERGRKRPYRRANPARIGQ